MADAILLETRGIPAVAICTDAFLASADATAVLRGMPGYGYATVPHPVSSLTPEQVKERAQIAFPQVVSLLLGTDQAVQPPDRG